MREYGLAGVAAFVDDDVVASAFFPDTNECAFVVGFLRQLNSLIGALHRVMIDLLAAWRHPVDELDRGREVGELDGSGQLLRSSGPVRVPLGEQAVDIAAGHCCRHPGYAQRCRPRPHRALSRE